MIVRALEELQPLLSAARTDLQYFDAVDALVWLSSPSSDPYFDLLGWDAEIARARVDLPFFAELALANYQTHQAALLRMYIAMARYSLQGRGRRGDQRIPYPRLVKFAEEALAYSTLVLQDTSTRKSDLGRGVEGTRAMIAAIAMATERRIA